MRIGWTHLLFILFTSFCHPIFSCHPRFFFEDREEKSNAGESIAKKNSKLLLIKGGGENICKLCALVDNKRGENQHAEKYGDMRNRIPSGGRRLQRTKPVAVKDK